VHCFDALTCGRASRARHAGHAVSGVPDPGDSGTTEDVRTLLRTHTSAMQIRYMLAHTPPIRIVVPGRVYRRDDLDLTHTPAFSQVERARRRRSISLSDLKGTLAAFARDMFGAAVARPAAAELLSVHRSRARSWISAAGNATAAAARCARKRVDRDSRLRNGAPAVFEAVATTPIATPASRGASGSSGWRSCGIRSKTSGLFYENDLRFLEQFPV